MIPTPDNNTATMICRHCQRELPVDAFERYRTGTRRRVCRQCKYQLYGKKAYKKWRMKQLAMALLDKTKLVIRDYG
jgi:hypothetical protein